MNKKKTVNKSHLNYAAVSGNGTFKTATCVFKLKIQLKLNI